MRKVAPHHTICYRFSDLEGLAACQLPANPFLRWPWQPWRFQIVPAAVPRRRQQQQQNKLETTHANYARATELFHLLRCCAGSRSWVVSSRPGPPAPYVHSSVHSSNGASRSFLPTPPPPEPPPPPPVCRRTPPHHPKTVY